MTSGCGRGGHRCPDLRTCGHEPEPSGEVGERTAGGRDLILRRDLPLEPDQAWAWITESGKTGQWFGTRTGAGEAGGEIEVTMVAEEGNPEVGDEDQRLRAGPLLRGDRLG